LRFFVQKRINRDIQVKNFSMKPANKKTKTDCTEVFNCIKEKNSPYILSTKNIRLKVVFSQNKNAPNIETALANIAIRKLI